MSEDVFYKVPRYVLQNLLAQFYGVGTKNIIFRKFSIEVVNPQKNVDVLQQKNK